MTTNEFFEQVVCLTSEAANKAWQQSRAQAELLGIKLHQILQVDGQTQTMPHGAPFSANELGELLSFYNVIRNAQRNRIKSVLILGDGVLFHNKYSELEEDVFAQVPPSWEVLYLGHSDAQLREPPKKDEHVHKAFWAKGTHAIAVSHRFYHLFLEDARVPRHNLDGHMHAVSLVSDTFVIIPKLVEPLRS